MTYSTGRFRLGWAIMAIALVSALGAIFVAPTAYAYDDYEYGYEEGELTLTSSSVLPMGTFINVVWASKQRPEKLWMFDLDYDEKIIFKASNQILIPYGHDEESLTQAMAAQELGEPAYLAVTIQLPTGEVLLSEPVRNNQASIDLSKPAIAKPNISSSYALKVTYVDDQGTRIPINNAKISLFSDDYDFASQPFSADGLLIFNQQVKSVGPLPLYVEIDFQSPDDPDMELSGVAILPAEGNGTFEFVMHSSDDWFERAHAKDTDAQYDDAWDDFDFNDLKQYIFTPAGSGKSVSGPIYAATPIDYQYNSSKPVTAGTHIRLTATPISKIRSATKFGVHSVDIGIENIAASLPKVAGKKVGSVTPKKMILTITDAKENLPALTVRTVKTLKNSKLQFSKPFTCTPGVSDPKSCVVSLPIIQTLLPGKSARIGIVVDTAPLKKGTTITMKIAKPTDLRYTYNLKNGKKKIIKTDHILSDKQVPFNLPSITK